MTTDTDFEVLVRPNLGGVGMRVGDHVMFAEPPPFPDMRERVPMVIGTWGQRMGPFFNPDDLVARYGLYVYDRMGADDQVWSALEVKRLARLATGFDIVPASDQPIDRQIRDFVSYSLDKIPGAFEHKMRELLSCLQYGFTVAEKLWEVDQSVGPWHGYTTYKDLKCKSPFGFQFIVDTYGNLMPQGVQLILGPTAGTIVETDKFVIWPYNKTFGNWYGRSDLRAAYRSYFSKNMVIAYYNLHIERYASPTAIAYIPDYMTLPEVASIRKALDTLQNQTTATFPDNVKVELLESRMGGAIAFKFHEAVDMHNRFIARAILVPDLMGYSGSVAGGSFALGKKQIDVFFMILAAMGNEIEEGVVGEQIIKPLVDLNFKGVSRYPRFRFREVDTQLDSKTKVLQTLLQGGVVDPREEWIRPYLDLPDRALPPPKAAVFTALDQHRRETGDVLTSLVCPACNKSLGADLVIDRRCRVGYHPDCLRYFGCRRAEHNGDVASFSEMRILRDGSFRLGHWGEKRPADSAVAVVRGGTTIDLKVEPGGGNGHVDDQDLPLPATAAELGVPEVPPAVEVQTFTAANKLPPQVLSLERATAFERIQREFDQVLAQALQWARPIFVDMRDKLLQRIRQRRLIERKDLPGVMKLSVNVGAYERLLRALYMTMVGNGIVEAASEVSKKLARVVHHGESLPAATTRLMPAPEAIDFFNKERLHVGDELIEIDLPTFLSGFFSQRAFLFAGADKEYILGRAREIMSTAISEGDPRAAEEGIAQLFAKYIPSTEVDAKGRPIYPVRLWNVLTTGASEAFNQGQRWLFDRPEVAKSVSAYLWSSKMDARTSPYCRMLNGQVFSREQMVTKFPPAHQHCFLAGTPVIVGVPLVAAGTIKAVERPIETVRAGDLLLTGRGFFLVECTHLSVYTGKMTVIEIMADGDTAHHVTSTATHPIYTATRGFVPAQDVRVGDVVKYRESAEADTQFVQVVAVASEHVVDQRVYNFTVETDPTYYASGVLVHNCRSKLIAVVHGEQYTLSKLDPNSPAPGMSRAEGFAEGDEHVWTSDGDAERFDEPSVPVES